MWWMSSRTWANTSKTDWSGRSTQGCVQDGMSRLYLLKKLRSFNVCRKTMEIFHHSGVIVHCTLLCCAAGDTKRLDELIRKANNVIGSFRLGAFETVVERRSLNKLLSIRATCRTSIRASFISHAPHSCLYGGYLNDVIIIILFILIIISTDVTKDFSQIWHK